MANESIYAAFERMWQHTIAKFNEVEIPKNEGNKTWRKIAEYKLEEDLTDATWIVIDKDADGNELDLVESLMVVHAVTDGSNGNAYYQAYKGNDENHNYVASNVVIRNGCGAIFHCEAIGYDGTKPQYIRTTVSENIYAYASAIKVMTARYSQFIIAGANMQLPKGCLAGTKYEFWGIDR